MASDGASRPQTTCGLFSPMSRQASRQPIVSWVQHVLYGGPLEILLLVVVLVRQDWQALVSPAKREGRLGLETQESAGKALPG